MHDSYMNYVFLCMSWTDWWERKQSTLHRKLYWIIRVGFYSFLLKQKVDKIKFLSTNAHLASRAEPPCLFKELIYAICSQIFRFALAYSAKIYRSHKYTYDILTCNRPEVFHKKVLLSKIYKLQECYGELS